MLHCGMCAHHDQQKQHRQHVDATSHRTRSKQCCNKLRVDVTCVFFPFFKLLFRFFNTDKRISDTHDLRPTHVHQP